MSTLLSFPVSGNPLRDPHTPATALHRELLATLNGQCGDVISHLLPVGAPITRIYEDQLPQGHRRHFRAARQVYEDLDNPAEAFSLGGRANLGGRRLLLEALSEVSNLGALPSEGVYVLMHSSLSEDALGYALLSMLMQWCPRAQAVRHRDTQVYLASAWDGGLAPPIQRDHPRSRWNLLQHATITTRWCSQYRNYVSVRPIQV